MDDVRDNIGNYNHKAERQGQQAADAFPAGNDDQGEDKNCQQDKDGARADCIGIIYNYIITVWA